MTTGFQFLLAALLIAVDAKDCYCKAKWDASGQEGPKCDNQKGCPSPPCNDEPDAWCMFEENDPGCDQNEAADGNPPWGYCVQCTVHDDCGDGYCYDQGLWEEGVANSMGICSKPENNWRCCPSADDDAFDGKPCPARAGCAQKLYGVGSATGRRYRRASPGSYFFSPLAGLVAGMSVATVVGSFWLGRRAGRQSQSRLNLIEVERETLE